MTLAEKYRKLIERGMPEPDDFGWSVEWQKFFVVTRFENELQTILLFNESHAEAIITVAALEWWLNKQKPLDVEPCRTVEIQQGDGHVFFCHGNDNPISSGTTLLAAILAATDA